MNKKAAGGSLRVLLLSFSIAAHALEIPAPVLRYTFDAPFGYSEPNAVGADHSAVIPRYSVQHPASERVPGMFGNAVRTARRKNIMSTFPAGKEFTVSFWIKPRDSYSPDIFRLGNLLTIGIPRDERDLFAKMGKASLSTPIEIGAWSSVTFTSTGEEVVFYLNGVEVGRDEITSAVDPRGMDMSLGGMSGAHHLYRGLTDEVRVYDAALTPTQVARISDPEQTLHTVPPEADAGPAHTVYLEPGGGIVVPVEGRTTGTEPAGVMWSVEKSPQGMEMTIEDPQSRATRMHFTTPGVYEIGFAAENVQGISKDITRVVVFPPHPERAPGRLHVNPNTPGTFPHAGVDPDNDRVPPPYDPEFVEKHFPEQDSPLHLEGFAADRFREPPPPYVHPRIFFNPEDLPAMRKRIRYNQAASSAYAAIRRMYEMKTRGTGRPADYIRKEVKENEIGYKWVSDHEAAAGYAIGAYIALIEGDGDLARKLIEASVRMAELQNERLEELEGWRKYYWQGTPHQVLGRYATSYVYDFLYPWMTPEEQDFLRGVISKATRDMRSIGMFSVPQAVARSNWVCWITGDLMVNVLAIEGEDGYDPVVFEEAANAMMKFSRYGILPDGSSFEGMGKNSITGENLVAMAKRGYYAIATENIYNFHTRFQLNVMQPYGNHFIADDLWGHSRFAGNSPDAAVMKFAYPDDPVIDFVYRNVVKGDQYRTPLFKTTFGYNSALVNCWFGEEWTGPSDWNAHATQALEGQPLDTHFNYSNIATARSSWDKDAVYLYFLPRMLGGHNSPSRGTFVFSALGRDWSLYPSGHNNKSTLQHSVITVKGRHIKANFARMTAFDSTPERMIAAADLRDYYGNRDRLDLAENDFRLFPAPGPWFDLPRWQLPDWLHPHRPRLAEAPEPELQPPALAAYRVAALVRTEHPYAVILDEMNIDSTPHTYRWQMVLPEDLRGHVRLFGNDAIITDPETGNFLLVRPVGSSAPYEARVDDNKFFESLVAFEAETPAWTFAVALIPFRKGEAIPETPELSGLRELLQEMKAHNQPKQ